MTKDIETLYLLILVATATAIGNSVGYHVSIVSSFIGVGILTLISFIGYLIGKLPGLKKLPVIVWISIVATLISAPQLNPYSGIILGFTDKVSLLAVCTPILTYAGLATGKDLAQFRKISWRIIPVSLAVFSGTFIFAAFIAQITLTWEGVIP